ncbi:MAG: hypothetical protein K2H15_04745, partial [Muribaculaceae bacterium]|nr:hypothetical protein [Muribaculaceae bacterium]
MKTIEISIAKDDIYKELERLTSYLGSRHPTSEPGKEEAQFRRVASCETDNPLLDRYFHQAIATLTERLKDYVEKSATTGGIFAMSLNVSEAYDDSRPALLTGAVASFLTASLARDWLRITMPDESALYESEANRLITECERRRCH